MSIFKFDYLWSLVKKILFYIFDLNIHIESAFCRLYHYGPPCINVIQYNIILFLSEIKYAFVNIMDETNEREHVPMYIDYSWQNIKHRFMLRRLNIGLCCERSISVDTY